MEILEKIIHYVATKIQRQMRIRRNTMIAMISISSLPYVYKAHYQTIQEQDDLDIDHSYTEA